MMNTDEGTWIGASANGVVILRQRDGEDSTVDRPATGRFREAGIPDVHDGQMTVDGVPLRRVTGLPAGLTAACGWYAAADGRQVLLAQMPEPYFGEPMVLLAEDDDVVRAYPLDATTFLTENGVVIELLNDGLRLTAHDAVTRLRRSPRYSEQEVAFIAGANVAGTLIRPSDVEGDCPAAVFVHVAAGGQRDFCRLFVQPLLDAGVAVLIYDKAGHGQSDGDDRGTIFDRANVASAGLDLLAGAPGIDAARIGLMGFSNGMWSVPLLAARRPDVAFVVGIGSPGVSMAESEVHRRVKALREAGVGPSTVDLAEQAWRLIFTIASIGSATDEQTTTLAGILGTLADAVDLGAYDVPDYARADPRLSAAPPLVPVADLIEMITGEPDPELLHDPAADYARLRCPVLLQYGSDDSNVPADVSVRRIEAAGGAAVTIRVYEGLEHQLNLIPADIVGLSPEGLLYGYHRFRFGPGVRRDLTTWLTNTL